VGRVDAIIAIGWPFYAARTRTSIYVCVANVKKSARCATWWQLDTGPFRYQSFLVVSRAVRTLLYAMPSIARDSRGGNKGYDAGQGAVGNWRDLFETASMHAPIVERRQGAVPRWEAPLDVPAQKNPASTRFKYAVPVGNGQTGSFTCSRTDFGKLARAQKSTREFANQLFEKCRGASGRARSDHFLTCSELADRAHTPANRTARITVALALCEVRTTDGTLA